MRVLYLELLVLQVPAVSLGPLIPGEHETDRSHPNEVWGEQVAIGIGVTSELDFSPALDKIEDFLLAHCWCSFRLGHGIRPYGRALAPRIGKTPSPCRATRVTWENGREYDPPMLLGRQAEQAAIDRLVQRARSGQGGGLVLRGEPGIGKSALLAHASQRAEEMGVLRSDGVEAESTLAYATLHRLLRPILDQAGCLPEPQARALRVALGLQAGPAPDQFLVAVAALTLLSEIAGERPLLCLVDDAHWADTPSVQALTFVARRLDAEPVALLLALRDGHDRRVEVAGLPELRLTGLDPEAAAALLDLRWGASISPAVRDRLLREVAGNPLALLELPGALSGHDALPDPLPLVGKLEQAFQERARRHDPATRTVLLLAAADGSGQLATVRHAAGALGLDPGLLESEGLADLVRIDGPTIAFLHPLVRSGVYHGASPAARRAAHQALADALESQEAGDDRRAWHRAKAATGPDDEVALELEGSAWRTLERAGHGAAAAALERAAELSRSLVDKSRRLVAAADATWHGGDTARARALLDGAERFDAGDAAVRLDIRYLRGLIELHAGVPSDGLAILLPAARQAVRLKHRRAPRMLLAAGDAAFHAGEDVAGEIGQLMAGLPADGEPGQAALIRLHQMVSPPGRAADPVQLRRDLAGVEELDDPEALVRAGNLAHQLGHAALARRLRAKAVARARALGAAGTLAWALHYLVLDELVCGRLAWAQASAVEGWRLALETGQPNVACQHQAALAGLAVLRGEAEQAHRLAEGALAEATVRRLVGAAVAARHALAESAFLAGRPEEAIEQLEGLLRLVPLGHRGIGLYAVPDLVEAAVRAGQTERGRQWHARHLAWAEGASSAQARALAARSRALLASGAEADRRFQEALRLHAQTDRPLDHARTALLYGEFLRRDRRRAEARPPLRTAVEIFEQLGASAWTQRARRELRATGQTVRKRHPSNLDQLTSQELQIVRAVGEGLTDREVAAQLFISPRTVDYHLRKIFRKLEIRSRAELIRRAPAGSASASREVL